MSEQAPRRPTADEATANASIPVGEGTGYACWYPQMGGYIGLAVVHFDGQSDVGTPCMEVWVWHDGDFPFGDELQPTYLHHCNAEQFVAFGQLALAKAAEMAHP